MTTVPLPPRTFYLRTFFLSFLLIVLCLVAFLFAVYMEAGVPSTGVIRSADALTLRAPVSGLVRLGWYEGETAKDVARRFHALASGDHIRPGQTLIRITPEDGRDGEVSVKVPDRHELWQVVQVHAEPGAAVKAGQALATVVPIDPKTHEPLNLVADLYVDETRAEEVRPGEKVRVYSAMYNSRLHGHAEAVIDRVDPGAVEGKNGKRQFHAVARITRSPVPLKLGTSVEAKIIVGHKPVYRIILEH